MGQPITLHQQLTDYLKKNLKKGYTSDTLKYALLSQGYSRTSIEKSLEDANKQLAQDIPKLIEKPEIKYTIMDGSSEEVQKSSSQSFFSKLKNLFR